MSRPSPAQEADAARLAVSDQGKAETLERLADMSAGVDPAHLAAHIRGVVAATLAHRRADALTATHDDAERWAAWALGIADGAEQGASTTA